MLHPNDFILASCLSQEINLGPLLFVLYNNDPLPIFTYTSILQIVLPILACTYDIENSLIFLVLMM